MNDQSSSEFFNILLSNERGFHLLFCDLVQSDAFTFYINSAFAEDPIFNHFVLNDELLSNEKSIETSKIEAVIDGIRTEAKTHKLDTTIFIEDFWPRSEQLKRAAIGLGYRVSDRMEVLSKPIEPPSALSTDNAQVATRFAVEVTQDFRAWNRIFMSSYAIPHNWEAELLKREHKILENGSGSFIIARDLKRANMPSGCLLTFEGPKQCLGIYCVGTIPEQRGKGIAREMLSFTETFALDSKNSFLTLQTLTSDNVSPMYKKIGYATQFEREILHSPTMY